MKIVPKYNRLIRPSLGNRPGTGRLFHYTSVDFKNKFSLKPTPLKIIQISSTVKNSRLHFMMKNTNLRIKHGLNNYMPHQLLMNISGTTTGAGIQ